MVNQNGTSSSEVGSLESELFDCIKDNNSQRVRELITKNRKKLNINCIDKDELTPLQHACHLDRIDVVKTLLSLGADPNFTQKQDGYTALMFAALRNSAPVVRVLLESGADVSIENSVRRTASQMAAFVGNTKIATLIDNWLPFETIVGPYTRCRELEDKPRIPSVELGHVLHDYIVFHNFHPIRLIFHIEEHIELAKHAAELKYVLENLTSKFLEPKLNSESQSMKCHYLTYALDQCIKAYNAKKSDTSKEFDAALFQTTTRALVKRLIKRDDNADSGPCTPNIDRFIIDCIFKYPYTQVALFKTTTYALAKREKDDHNSLFILNQILNGATSFGRQAEACIVCGDTDKNMKCGKCKSVHYCSQRCQKADWFQHKNQCADPEQKPLLSCTDD